MGKDNTKVNTEVNTSVNTIDKQRVNFYMPVELLEQIDEHARKNLFSRSIMIQVMCKTYIDQQEVMNALKNVKNLEGINGGQ